MDDHPTDPTRRRFLVGSAAIATWWLAGCSDDGDDGSGTSARPSTSAAPLPADGDEPAPALGSGDAEPLGPADFEALAVCALLPAMAEGPFPNPDELVRRDITEDRPGRALRLGLRVVDASCSPVSGVAVDVWHADPSGDYSAYVDGGSGKDEGDDTTFLRGTQISDVDGIVEFRTLYPGWYEGRAIHIHLTARIAGGELLTTQLSFPDETNDAVLATGEYATFGPPDTSNADDVLFAGVDLATTTLAVNESGAGDDLVALLNLGVPSAG